MARPRNPIPEHLEKELVAAAEQHRADAAAADKSNARLRAAANAAFIAGASHATIAELAGIAKVTAQKYVTARRNT